MAQNIAINKLEDLINQNLPFKANQNQLHAINKLSKFIFNSYTNSIFLLKGYAGTGKTSIISAVTKSLPLVKLKFVLLAPTGRAAKVMSSYSNNKALTIHKKIFQNTVNSDGTVSFSLAENLHTNTIFFVDEASMISTRNSDGNDLLNVLENLFEYVYSGINCKLIFIGDTAQLPPVGEEDSLALSQVFLKASYSLNIFFYELVDVERQAGDSSILYNATQLRINLLQQSFSIPQFICDKNFVRLLGDELEDTLNNSISKYGDDNVVIITRSNSRAVLFNKNFRNRIKYFEDDLCTGDKLMIVKNNYYWLDDDAKKNSFIANGDVCEIVKIYSRTSIYGFDFCDCDIRFIEQTNQPVIKVKLNLSSLYSNTAALSSTEMNLLYQELLKEYFELGITTNKLAYIKNNAFYNALQVKFSYAFTCHKSQGGQWPVVFIDQGYLQKEQLNHEFLRWLYTAITRATQKVYLINFNEQFF